MSNQADSVDTLLAAIEKLTLWTHFHERASDEQRATVKKLLAHADALLGRVVETFPTYTLHDRTHAVNVAHLMGKLVEPWLDRLNALEAALLLLSAFWHDAGMVFTEEDREKIPATEEFQSFLRTHPEAQLEVAREGGPTRDVVEWFCRWSHAERVFHHLNQLDGSLEWDGVSLRQQLGDLCRSHNLDVAELKRDDLVPTDFLAKADTRLCAVLLRLADIMDFDRSRSPEPIYRYLRLGRRETPRKTASDVEWLKHLNSTGFYFPAVEERRTPYPLSFVAAPDEPAVEWDLRAFLDVIEGELLACQQIVRVCSPRWQDVALPVRIARNNIHSQNYRFGDYRFLLDQEQVLGLLMGDNLYENPYVFVRELLQNALDTSRHREFHERSRGKADFTAEPIVVTEWYDHEQYHWVRIDDFGMGMTEEIVRNFLLRVGRSYYGSAEFRAEQLQYQAQQGFTPISRFGIGLLSCFIAGDRVEISTRHAVHAKSQADAIRLSLSGLHGFFTLQTGPDVPRPMPGAKGEEPGYRAKPGTSVAVRLDPRKERSHLDVGRMLEKYVLCPPVPVVFEGEPVGGDPAALVEKPRLDQAIGIELTPQEMQPFVERLAVDPGTRVYLGVVPLDLTAHSPTEKLRGQMVCLVMTVDDPGLQRDRAFRVTRNFSVDVSDDGITVESSVSRLLGGDAKSEPDREYLARVAQIIGSSFTTRESISVDRLWSQVPADVRAGLTAAPNRKIHLSHNGIAVDPKIETSEADGSIAKEPVFMQSTDNSVATGVILLMDELRPDVSVSRESLKGIPWNAALAVELAYGRAARSAFGSGGPLRPLLESGLRSRILLAEVIHEPALSREGLWDDEPVLGTTPRGFHSPRTMRETLAAGARDIELSRDHGFEGLPETWSTHELVERVVLQRDFTCVLRLTGRSNADVFITGPRATPVSPGELLFPPLYFIEFEKSEALKHPSYAFVNSGHAVGRWLLDTAPQLAERVPGIFNFVREHLMLDLEELDMGEWLLTLNSALARLRAIDPSLAPAKRRDLTRSDIAYADEFE